MDVSSLSDVEPSPDTDFCVTCVDAPSITRERLLGLVTNSVKPESEVSPDLLQFNLRCAVMKGDLPRVSSYLLRGATIADGDEFMLSLAPNETMKRFVSREASHYVALLNDVRASVSFEELQSALRARGRQAHPVDEDTYHVIRHAVVSHTLRLVETCFPLSLQFFYLKPGLGDEIVTIRLVGCEDDESSSSQQSKRVCRGH